MSADGGNEDLVLGVQVGRSIGMFGFFRIGPFVLHAFSGLGDECKDKDGKSPPLSELLLNCLGAPCLA